MQAIKSFSIQNPQIFIRALNHGNKQCLKLNNLKKFSRTSFEQNRPDDIDHDKGYDRSSNVHEKHKKFARYFDPFQNLAEKHSFFDFKTYSLTDWSSVLTVAFFTVLLVVFLAVDLSGNLKGNFDRDVISKKKIEAAEPLRK